MTAGRPPLLAQRLMARVLPTRAAQHGVLGDLHEEYLERRRHHQRLACDWWYWRQAILVALRFSSAGRRGGGDARPKGEVMSSWAQSIRQALRAFRRHPGFALTALFTLTLGVGATATMFGFVQSILLRPLAYPEPQRIVAVWPGKWLSKPVFKMLEDQASSFEAVAGWAPRRHVLLDEEGARFVAGPRVTARFFDVLHPQTQLGRTFSAGEDLAGSDGVVVLSHGFWQSRFGGSPTALGTRLRLREQERTVIGIMPAGLDLLMPGAEVVLPQDMAPSAPGYGYADLMVIGRLKRGITIEQAQDEFRAVMARARQEFSLPDDWDASARLVPYHDYLVGEVRPALLLLFGAVALLLLVSTANLASLFLARSLTRLREVSIRLALGAGPLRVLRDLWTESALLGLLGVLPGLALAALGVRALLFVIPSEGLYLPTQLPRLNEVQVDRAVVVFTLLASVTTACLAGVFPALKAVRSDVQPGLAAHSRGGTEVKGRRRLRAGIVVAETALVVLLLTGCGLLVKSYWRLSTVDPGFQPRGLLAFNVFLPEEWEGPALELQAHFEDLQTRLAAIPEVESAAAAWNVPFAPDGGVTGAYAAARPPAPGEAPHLFRWRPVMPQFFQTAGIPLLEGRLLSEDDRPAGPQAAVLSQSAAQRLFADRSALGQEVIGEIERNKRLQVVGIVGDVKSIGLDQDSPATIYRPFRQSPSIGPNPIRTRSFLLRTARPQALASQMRAAVQSWDRNALLSDLQPMPHMIAGSLAKPRGTMLFISLFTAAALLLGAVGVYGVVAYAVRERSREFGVRVALGATQGKVMRHILADGFKWTGSGMLAGLAAALALSRFLKIFVFEVEPSDPWVLACALTVSSSAALLAMLIPARRAGRVDPILVLKE